MKYEKKVNSSIFYFGFTLFYIISIIELIIPIIIYYYLESHELAWVILSIFSLYGVLVLGLRRIEVPNSKMWLIIYSISLFFSLFNLFNISIDRSIDAESEIFNIFLNFERIRVLLGFSILLLMIKLPLLAPISKLTIIKLNSNQYEITFQSIFEIDKQVIQVRNIDRLQINNSINRNVSMFKRFVFLDIYSNPTNLRNRIVIFNEWYNKHFFNFLYEISKIFSKENIIVSEIDNRYLSRIFGQYKSVEIPIRSEIDIIKRYNLKRFSNRLQNRSLRSQKLPVIVQSNNFLMLIIITSTLAIIFSGYNILVSIIVIAYLMYFFIDYIYQKLQRKAYLQNNVQIIVNEKFVNIQFDLLFGKVSSLHIPRFLKAKLIVDDNGFVSLILPNKKSNYVIELGLPVQNE